jgi:hypothetical protein
MFSKRIRVILLCAVALVASAARAATLNVGPGQTYTTIQSAINAASDFDTVLVAPGTYTENIDLLGKWITVTSSGGAAVTIIDGSAKAAPAVTIEQGGTHIGGTTGAPTFSGFTVTNGGSGAATSPTGGIYVNLSNGLIANNYLVNNHCAGLWVVMLESPPTVQNNQVMGTTDNFDCPVGGGSGIVVSRSSSGCVNCKSIPIPITGNNILFNNQGGHEVAGGGGITVLGGVAGAQIQNNQVHNNFTVGIGGGIFLGISNAEVVQNLVYDNGAVCGGAGVATQRAAYTSGAGTLLLANNTLYHNTLSGAACTASQAGNGSELLFGDEGSLTYPAVVVNNILSGSSSQPMIGCAFVNDAAAGLRDTPVFDHNLLYNSGGRVIDSASCADPNALLTDVNADPQFVNAASYNFQVLSTSPAIDAGNNNALPLDNYSTYFTVNTTTDFAGNPRLADATGKGYATIDIGAYEFAGTADTPQTNVSLGVVGVSGEFFLLTAKGGSSITLDAVVASPVGGATGCVGPVSLLEDGAAVASANIVAYTNTATFNNVFLAPGTHHFAASYAAQGPCSAGVSVQIIYIVSNYAPTVTLSSSPNPSVLGNPVLFTVTATSPDNTVLAPITLTNTTTNTVLATLTPNAAGMATFTTSSLPLGYSTITASYAGDATHNSASASVTQDVVDRYATASYISCVPNPVNAGATALCTINVTSANGTPTGTVTLTDNLVTIATLPLTAGAATYTYTATTPGLHTLVLAYPVTGVYDGSGDVYYLAVNGLPTTTTLLITPPKASFRAPVTLTATVTPVTPIASPQPTGTVTFMQTFPPTALVLPLGAAPVGANGVAAITLTSLPTGTDNITCSYSGDASFAASLCTPGTVTIVPVVAPLTLSSSPNPALAGAPITFTVQATLNGQPAVGQGINLIYTPTGTAQVVVRLITDATGTATYTLAQGLGAGSYLFNAVWTTSTSTTNISLTQVVLSAGTPDFAISGPGSFNLLTTTSGGVPLTLTSTGGFAGNVALTCSATIPQYVCSVTPSVAVAANGSAVATLSLQWVGLQQASRGGGVRAMLAGVLLVGLWGLRRRRRWVGLVCLAVMACAISACGTEGYPTIFGSFPVTVTATGAGTTHMATVTAQIVR